MSIYNIWMMGPSRSGKTTLIASIINDFMRISEEANKKSDSVLKLQAMGDTYGRISDRIDSIQTATYDGSFDTGCLAGTQDHEIFKTGISYQKKAIPIFEPAIEINFHDFPGGWLSNPDKRQQLDFHNAEVLIIPIDSSLVFEAQMDNEKQAAIKQLELTSLLDTAKIWANQRKEQKRGGLLLFVPVKCETYFNDHAKLGLEKNNARALHDKIFSDQFFKNIKDTVRNIYPDITAWYLPVDTVGCCFISRKRWNPSEKFGKELNLRYTIPSGSHWTPYGPAQIMLKILDFIITRHEMDKSFMDDLFEKMGWRTNIAKNLERMKAVCQSDAVPYQRGQKIW